MKSNMGTIDKAVRILLAAAVAAFHFSGAISGTAAAVLGALAGIMVATSIVGFCPLYKAFSISTRKRDEAAKAA